jgi:hypothetical protein
MPRFVVFASTLTATFLEVSLKFGLRPFLSLPAHEKDLRKRSLHYWYAQPFPEILLRLEKLFNRFLNCSTVFQIVQPFFQFTTAVAINLRAIPQ